MLVAVATYAVARGLHLDDLRVCATGTATTSSGACMPLYAEHYQHTTDKSLSSKHTAYVSQPHLGFIIMLRHHSALVLCLC
jgi:hypothetical protein